MKKGGFMRSYNVAIIGTQGHYGYVNSIRTTQQEKIHVSAVASATNDAEEIQKMLDVFESHNPQAYYCLEKLLIADGYNVGVIAPPFNLNAIIAQKFVLKGIPILLEKPFSTTFKDLIQLNNVLQNQTYLIHPMFDLRYAPPFYTARKLIQNGILGELILITSQKSYKLSKRAAFYTKRETYGGTIPWVGIHAVDFIRYTCGVSYCNVHAVQTRKGNQQHGELETAAIIHLETDQGVIVEINIDYLRPNGAITHGDDRLRVAGTKGVLEIQRNQLHLIDNRGEHLVPLETPIYPLFEDYLVTLEDPKHIPLCTALDGLYATYVVLRAQQAADLGKRELLDYDGFLKNQQG
jgi:predicted dehydrogenase